MKSFAVTISYQGCSTYIVEAESADDAKEKAKERYLDGDSGEMTGAEYEDINDIVIDDEAEGE